MKQLLLLAVIHLLIFHQYKKDKSETLAPKKDIKPVETVIHTDEDYPFRSRFARTRINETADSVNKSVQLVPLRPTHAVYFLPAIPAILK